MADREKVIKGLEVCRDMDNPPGYRFTSCDPDCPYHGKGCARKLKEDAIALLKEQEEKQTPKPIIHGYKEEYWGEEEICPVCGKRWQSADIDSTHFCPGCGQAVIWENT